MSLFTIENWEKSKNDDTLKEKLSKVIADICPSQKHKFNVPKDLESFNNGNGEGMWCIGATTEDVVKLDDDNYYGLAKIYVLNDSIYYPNLLNFMDAIEVQCHGNKRAVITKEHFDNLNSNQSETTKRKKYIKVEMVKTLASSVEAQVFCETIMTNILEKEVSNKGMLALIDMIIDFRFGEVDFEDEIKDLILKGANDFFELDRLVEESNNSEKRETVGSDIMRWQQITKIFNEINDLNIKKAMANFFMSTSMNHSVEIGCDGTGKFVYVRDNDIAEKVAEFLAKENLVNLIDPNELKDKVFQ
ncbi:MAG: hypothetical protein ACRC92_21565 [Peptostreptococcaceae bacterium]